MDKVNRSNVDMRKLIHNVLLFGLERVEQTKVEFLNEMDLKGYNGPVIFSPNHSNVHDFPMICKILKEHVYVLVGNDIENGWFNTLMLSLNGVVFVDRKSKESCQKAKNELIALLREGQSIVMFPEGTWNLDSVKLIHDFKWGIIDIAKKANVPIVPIGLKYNINDKCYVKFGEPIYVPESSDLFTKKEELHTAMSTLIWDIIDSFPKKDRETEYEEIKESYDKYVEKCLKEFPYDIEYERSLIFNDQLYPSEIVGPTYQNVSDRIYTKRKKLRG